MVPSLFRFDEQTFDLGLPRDVGLNGDGFSALANDLGYDAVGAFLAGSIVNDHSRTLCGQMFRNQTRLFPSTHQSQPLLYR